MVYQSITWTPATQSLKMDKGIQKLPKLVEGEVVKPVTTWDDVKKSWSELSARIKKAVEENKPVDRVCRNCKHWQAPYDPETDSFDTDSMNVCGLISYEQTRLAQIMGKGGVSASLRTMDIFGCNQFEPEGKNENPANT
jgi:hypothetical protein